MRLTKRELQAKLKSLAAAKLANVHEPHSESTNPTLDDELDDNHPLCCINSKIDGLLQGQGASEDHEDVIAFFLKTGLPRSTVDRIHHAIVWGDMKTDLRADIFRDMINELRDTAKTFHNHDSLRERLRGVVNKFIKVQL